MKKRGLSWLIVLVPGQGATSGGFLAGRVPRRGRHHVAGDREGERLTTRPSHSRDTPPTRQPGNCARGSPAGAQPLTPSSTPSSQLIVRNQLQLELQRKSTISKPRPGGRRGANQRCGLRWRLASAWALGSPGTGVVVSQVGQGQAAPAWQRAILKEGSSDMLASNVPCGWRRGSPGGAFGF